MSVKLLTEYHLECVSFRGGSRGSSGSTLVKMSNCWKSHATAQIFIYRKAMLQCYLEVVLVEFYLSCLLAHLLSNIGLQDQFLQLLDLQS